MKKKRGNMCISFDNIESLLISLEHLKKSNIQILDIYSPVPIPNIHHYLKTGRTQIAQMGLVGTIFGIALAFIMQWYVMTIGYPLKIGGYPNNSIVTYFPVVFECAVLGAGIAMFLTFIIESKFGFRSAKKIIHNKITDSFFVVECHNKRLLASTQECLFFDFDDGIYLNQLINEEKN